MKLNVAKALLSEVKDELKLKEKRIKRKNKNAVTFLIRLI